MGLFVVVVALYLAEVEIQMIRWLVVNVASFIYTNTIAHTTKIVALKLCS